jgi:hypothetical protein
MPNFLSNPKSRALGASIFCLPFAFDFLLDALDVDQTAWLSQTGSNIVAVISIILMLAGLWLFGAPLFRSALIGLALVVPFAAMEVVNRRAYNEDFPFVLFGGMWFISSVFVAILLTLIQDLRAGKAAASHPLSLLVRAVILVAIAVAWFGLVADQMPCFLGVRYCD